MQATSHFWETEILVRAQKRHLHIDELPVLWEDRAEEVSKARFAKGAGEMGISLIKLRWNLFPKSLCQLFKFSMVGVSNTLITLLILIFLESIRTRK